MKIFKTIIVEDDAMSRKSLEILIQKLESLELIGSFENSENALKFLENEVCDLIILDVEMPGISGIEMIEHLKFSPQIILSSGNKEYAADAFDLEITDFIVKPINLARLQIALDKVISQQNYISGIQHASIKNEIYIKSDGIFIRMPINDILYFENVGDYIKVITERGNYIIYGTLKSLAKNLNHNRLLKVHRSFIVNLGKIKQIQDNSITLENKKIIPISRAHKSLLFNSINLISQ